MTLTRGTPCILLLIIYNCCVLWLYVCIEIYTLQLYITVPSVSYPKSAAPTSLTQKRGVRYFPQFQYTFTKLHGVTSHTIVSSFYYYDIVKHLPLSRHIHLRQFWNNSFPEHLKHQLNRKEGGGCLARSILRVQIIFFVGGGVDFYICPTNLNSLPH